VLRVIVSVLQIEHWMLNLHDLQVGSIDLCQAAVLLGAVTHRALRRMRSVPGAARGPHEVLEFRRIHKRKNRPAIQRRDLPLLRELLHVRDQPAVIEDRKDLWGKGGEGVALPLVEDEACSKSIWTVSPFSIMSVPPASCQSSYAAAATGILRP